LTVRSEDMVSANKVIEQYFGQAPWKLTTSADFTRLKCVRS
jgi:hypothetical protein